MFGGHIKSLYLCTRFARETKSYLKTENEVLKKKLKFLLESLED